MDETQKSQDVNLGGQLPPNNPQPVTNVPIAQAENIPSLNTNPNQGQPTQPVVPTQPAQAPPPEAVTLNQPPQTVTPLPAPPQPATPGEVPISAKHNGKTFRTLHKHQSLVSVILPIFVLLFVGFNILFSLHILHVRKVTAHNIYNNLPSTEAAVALKNFGPQVEPNTTGKLILGKQITPTLTEKNQNITAGLKDQINLFDGESFMINSVQTNWQSIDQYNTPPTGDYYILLNEVSGNRSNEPQAVTPTGAATATVNGQTIQDISALVSNSDFSNPSTIICSNDFNNTPPGQQYNCVDVISVPDNSIPILNVDVEGFDLISGKSVDMKANIQL